MVPAHLKHFAFLEQAPDDPEAQEPGLDAFLRDPTLSGEVTAEELAFLKRLKFTDKQPTPLYYYREVQNLRDPLHFRTP